MTTYDEDSNKSQTLDVLAWMIKKREQDTLDVLAWMIKKREQDTTVIAALLTNISLLEKNQSIVNHDYSQLAITLNKEARQLLEATSALLAKIHNADLSYSSDKQPIMPTNEQIEELIADINALVNTVTEHVNK